MIEEASATPSTDWPPILGALGDELLVELLGVGNSSLRRYASGELAVPDEVAARLHWLAIVAADLAGAYADVGIRRWFERPRSQLDGQSPRKILGAVWTPMAPRPHECAPWPLRSPERNPSPHGPARIGCPAARREASDSTLVRCLGAVRRRR